MGKEKTVKAVLAGILMAFAVSVLLLLLSAFFLLQMKMDTEKTELVILAVYFAACLAGGFFCGKKQTRRRFLWGLITGICYFLILFLVSGMGDDPVKPQLFSSLIVFLLCAAGGMIGGMLG